MQRFLFRLRQRTKARKGQGLVEYALILVLVAIVVIAIVTIFGQTLTQVYCTAVVNLNKPTGALIKNRACGKPLVTCEVVALSGGNLTLEAVVFDPDRAPNMTLTDAIDVQFYRNGVAVGTVEFQEKFCYPNSSVPAGSPPTSPACSGTVSVNSGDVIRAVATDNNNDVGECSYRVP